MSDKSYIAKVGNKYLSGHDLVKSKKDADVFESKTEPTQRVNQLKKDGKISKNMSVSIEEITSLKEEIEDFDSKFHKPYSFAKTRHDATGAIRKFSGAPYMVHPDGVAKIVDAYGGDTNQINAALAHDLLEDTPTSYEEIEEVFGEEAAHIVRLITNDADEVKHIGKEKYISNELLRLPHKALLVKLADMYYNFTDHCPTNQATRIINNMIALSKRKDLTENELDLIDDIMSLAADAA